jgi:hypothetical protein
MRPVEVAAIRSNIVRLLRDGAAQVGSRFTEPDDDWQFVAVGARRDGEFLAIGVDPAFFVSPDHKDKLVALLAEIAKQNSFVAFGTIVSAWEVRGMNAQEMADYEQGRGPALSERPDRIEVVQITGIDRFGDESYRAPIMRSATAPPKLEAWERFGAAGMGGRFIDPFREALRLQG